MDGKNGGTKFAAMRRGVLGTSALAAAGLLAKAARADSAAASRLYEVLKRGHLIVGTGSTNPPWHFEDDKGELAGLDIEMGRTIAKGLFDDPTKVEFLRQADDVRIPNLLTDKVDVTIQFMTVTAGRAQQVEFSIPYYRSGVALLLLSDGSLRNYDALKAAGAAVTMAILRNTYAEQLAHEALPQANVMQVDSQANVVQAVVSGRAQCGAVGKAQLRWFMQAQPGKFADAGFYWFPQTYGAAVRPGDAIWLNFINTCFHEAMVGVESQVYREAFRKYFGEELPPVKVGAPIEYFG